MLADLIAMFSGSPNFSAIDFLDDESQIAEPSTRGQRLMVLSHPIRFFSRAGGGRPTQRATVLDGRRSNAAQIVEGYANAIVARLQRGIAVGQPRRPRHRRCSSADYGSIPIKRSPGTRSPAWSPS